MIEVNPTIESQCCTLSGFYSDFFPGVIQPQERDKKEAKKT